MMNGSRTEARRRAGRIAAKIVAYAAVLAAATGVAYYATRGDAMQARMTPAGGHDHGASAASSGVAQPIALTAAEARRIGVTFAEATVGAMVKEVRTVGHVAIDESRLSTISLKVDGWVERLDVNVTGQRVQRGDPLLAIYSPMLITAQEELLLATRLRGDIAGGSDPARANAEDLVTSARRRLEYWGIGAAEIAAIEASGEPRRTITFRAPTSGYVVERRVTVGQRIMSGEPILMLADLSSVWVDGEVFEQDLGIVRTGQSVRVDLEAYPGEPRTGTISNIYPTLDPETRTARVRVVLSNSDGRLRPGMYATIRIAAARRASVISVPRSAVLSTGERSIVFVQAQDGRLAPREVVAGVSVDDRTEILRGLAAGEVVVSSATFLVDAESNLGRALDGMKTAQPDGGTPPAAPPAEHRH